MERAKEVTEKDELEASVKKNLVQINVDTNEVTYAHFYLNVCFYILNIIIFKKIIFFTIYWM